MVCILELLLAFESPFRLALMFQAGLGIIKKWLNSGHQHAKNPLELRQIQLSNKVYLVFPFLAVQYFVVFWYAGNMPLALTFVPCFLICFFYIWLNEKGYINLSRHLSYNIYNAVIIFYATNAPEATGISLLLVTSIYLPMILFRQLSINTIIFGCVTPVVLFFLRKAEFWPKPLYMQYPPEIIEFINVNIHISAFFFIFLSIYIFEGNTSSYERQLEKSMKELNEVQQKLLESAHRAGMADIASTVLHNIGNSVNSLGTEVSKIKQNLLEEEIETLKKMSLYFDKVHKNNSLSANERSIKIQQILNEFTSLLEQSNKTLLTSVERMEKTSNHIKKSISSQQKYASGMEFTQQISVKELINDSLDLIKPKIEKQNVQIICEIESNATISIPKVKVVNVLVNLVVNAVEATENIMGDRKVLVRAFDSDGVKISVKDNGVGFGNSIRDQLFQYGFTTKKNGHGFGLHDCANTIDQIRGTISAHSSGIDHGAEFCIHLPESVKVKLAA